MLSRLKNSAKRTRISKIYLYHLSRRSVLISVWHTGALMRFAWATARRYIMFREIPKDHWYPDAHLVFAFPSNSQNV